MATEAPLSFDATSTEVTEPLPALNTPLTTPQQLAVWLGLPQIPPDKADFADQILMGVAVVIRMAGDPKWTIDNIHPRAKLLADIKAKDFYQHPNGEQSETVGPLSSRYIDDVMLRYKLTEDEETLLAGLVDHDGDPTTPNEGIPGLWVMSTTRGPVETHQGSVGVLTVPWWRGSSFPYYAEGAFGSPEA